MKPACEVTHPQITAGKCPWCDEVLSEVDSENAAAETVWHVDAMASALNDANPMIRVLTVTNLGKSGLPFDVSLPLFSKALNEKSGRVSQQAEQALTHLGRHLPAEDVPRLEAKIAGSSNELALRILVLPSYFLRHRESDAVRERRNEHIYWLIQHAPESQTVGLPYASIDRILDRPSYDKAKQLWLEQIDTNSARAKIHANAAKFFMFHDLSLCEDLLKKARDLEPSNPEWAEQLGHFYSLQRRGSSADARANAAKAFQALAVAEELREREPPPPGDESSEEPSEEEERSRALLMAILNLPDLAKAAFAASEFEQARSYATELLEKATSPELDEYFRNDGNAIHYANLILGRLAFREGEVERAKQRLIASGKTKGSPNLGSFGPNMSLAKELLECGEQETVLRYFELCRKFWGSHGEVLDQWTKDVRAGRIPQFGANLVY
jgi:hypothetical protein